MTKLVSTPLTCAAAISLLLSPGRLLLADADPQLQAQTGAESVTTSFSRLTYVKTVPLGRGDRRVEEFTVEANGLATLRRSSKTARYRPLAAQLNASQLQGLRDSFARSNIQALNKKTVSPATRSTERVVVTAHVGARTFSFTRVGDEVASAFATARPLLSALENIKTDLESQPAVEFTKLSLRTNNFGPQPSWSCISVDASGKVTYESGGAAGSASREGYTTFAELRAVDRAFHASNICIVSTYPGSTVPEQIDGPQAAFQIRLTWEREGTERSVHAPLDGYGKWTPRVKPIVDALRAIEARITAVEQDVTGFVVTTPGGVALCVAARTLGLPARTYTVTNAPFAAMLQGLVGSYVKAHVLAGGSEATVSYLVGTSTCALAVQRQAQATAPAFTTIPAGAPVKVTGIAGSNRYYSVEANGRRGYVLKEHVTLVHAAPELPRPQQGVVQRLPMPAPR